MSASAPEQLLEPGTVIRNTLTVEGVLGTGAFGTVYRVRHRFLGTQAMKVFRVGLGRPSADEILVEARLLSGLVHPNIVRVHDASTLTLEGEERPYMTMEFVAGGSLEDALARRTRLNTLSAVAVVSQLCSALEVAHSAQPPIVHRDIKLQNILVSRISNQGMFSVKLGDFGLARPVDRYSLMTTAAGTLAYLAPESGWGVYTPASDVYACAIVLYRLLTGVFPFAPVESEMAEAALRDAVARTRRHLPPPPSRYCLGLPTQLDDVTLRALAPDPSDRFRDAAAFGCQLRDIVGTLQCP
jgi:serine/threonine-protein kinase